MICLWFYCLRPGWSRPLTHSLYILIVYLCLKVFLHPWWSLIPNNGEGNHEARNRRIYYGTSQAIGTLSEHGPNFRNRWNMHVCVSACTCTHTHTHTHTHAPSSCVCLSFSLCHFLVSYFAQILKWILFFPYFFHTTWILRCYELIFLILWSTKSLMSIRMLVFHWD